MMTPQAHKLLTCVLDDLAYAIGYGVRRLPLARSRSIGADGRSAGVAIQQRQRALLPHGHVAEMRLEDRRQQGHEAEHQQCQGVDQPDPTHLDEDVALCRGAGGGRCRELLETARQCAPDVVCYEREVVAAVNRLLARGGPGASGLVEGGGVVRGELDCSGRVV